MANATQKSANNLYSTMYGYVHTMWMTGLSGSKTALK